MFFRNSDSPASCDAPKPEFVKAFSYVYVEEAAFRYKRTKQILSRLPNATVIPCLNYKSVFCRPHQEPTLQKHAQALILAVSQQPPLYAGAPVCQNFGNDSFFYTADVMNCIFDCEYCYLQGMYDSAHIVAFVNLEDTMADLDIIFRESGRAYVCISYDTDLLALEPILGYTADWLKYAADRPGLSLEVRTKCASKNLLHSLPFTDNAILAVTISPDPVIAAREHFTPNLDARLAFVSEALDLGIRVRLCFDPILAVPDGEAVYNAMFDRVFASVNMLRIEDVSVGLFRISKDYLHRMRKHRPCAVTYYPYELTDGVYHYPHVVGKPLLDLAISRLSKVMPAEKIFLWDSPDP